MKFVSDGLEKQLNGLIPDYVNMKKWINITAQTVAQI